MFLLFLLNIILARELWPEEILTEDLLKNYKKSVRPINSQSFLIERSGEEKIINI